MSGDGGINWASWAPVGLTLVGWFLVNFQANKRETRKEKRAAADRCKNLINDAAAMGIDYWTGDAEEASWKIRALLEELELELEHFPLYGGTAPIVYHYVQFVNTITGNDFETKRRSRVKLTDPLVALIRQRRLILIREVEKKFRVHFG